METTFNKSELERVKFDFTPPPVGVHRMISPCMNQTMQAAALKLISIVLSEVNQNGKIPILSLAAFRIVKKLLIAAAEIVTMHKACRDAV